MDEKRTHRKRRISIRTRLMLLVLAVILVLSSILGVVLYRNMRKVLMRETVNEMNLFCRERGMEIDTDLIRIEDSVATVSNWFLQRIEEEGEDLSKLHESREYRDEILKEAQNFLLLSAGRIDGASTIYFRYALELTDNSEEGSFFVRGSDGIFREEPLTQILQYDKDDKEHVGWYYIPIEKGRAIWMPPYHNDNINVDMISYEKPVYSGNTLVGLIGMDIDFSTLVKKIDNITYQRTGYMYLKEADGSVHYHPDYLNNVDVHGDEEDYFLSGMEELGRTESNDIIHYTFRGGDRVMVFMTLRNGLRLVLCDGYEEIFLEANQTLAFLMYITVALFILAALGLIWITNRFTYPIVKLSEASLALSEGNYDVELPKETGDEVGDLIRAFRTAVGHLKQYSDNMETIAYQDALTRVKNAAAYKVIKDELNHSIEKGLGEFAVVMLDLNFLKETNDRYGHSAGDILLMRFASIICKSFPLSGVYRIGGDEFTVILTGTEYESRRERVAELERRIRAGNASAVEPYLNISAAYGMAVYDSETDHSYDEVYRRADREMYQMKQKMHKPQGKQL